ncbi:MAG TPA: protocatechuate dioxygenase [Gammaproteobacteria bacterium]|nr:protocatechuate dioxygenase [Gammaproteobacteria bacterium]
MTSKRPALHLLGRRRVLTAASACAFTLALPRAFGQAASCTVTPDSGEGPFYFDPALVRSDVTSGRPGVPLEVAFQITRGRDCAPLPGARLDLWQADALGLYSGYERQDGVGGISIAPAVGATFLRGTQIADSDGWVRFKTVYPSWYGGRTPHIHFKVFLAARERLAGQAFFEDEVNAEIFEKHDPYREHFRKRKAFNNNDPFIDANHDGNVDGVFWEIERYDGGSMAAKTVLTVNEA